MNEDAPVFNFSIKGTAASTAAIASLWSTTLILYSPAYAALNSVPSSNCFLFLAILFFVVANVD